MGFHSPWHLSVIATIRYSPLVVCGGGGGGATFPPKPAKLSMLAATRKYYFDTTFKERMAVKKNIFFCNWGCRLRLPSDHFFSRPPVLVRILHHMHNISFFSNCHDLPHFFLLCGSFSDLLLAVCPRFPATCVALLASQRVSARPRRRREVEHALQRRLCQPVRVRWRWPRAAQRRACDRLLDCDWQHTPPTP